jgi:hypothetical protein
MIEPKLTNGELACAHRSDPQISVVDLKIRLRET